MLSQLCNDLGYENSVLIIGCGDTGQCVVALCLKKGRPMSALMRFPNAVAHLHAQGIMLVTGNLVDPALLRALHTRDALVYYFAPPPAEEGTDSRMAAFLGTISAGQ